MNKRKIGKIGEDIATMYLEKNKYKIIERNFRCKQGEIDIIAKNNKNIIFIEVKMRTSKKYGEPLEAITKEKQLHIYKTAKYYLYKNQIKNLQIRFDAIEVLLINGKYKVNHVKQII